MEPRRYRVAQWGTGHTGMHSLKKVIAHPRYDLVGVRVYSDAKVGRDAGDLAGTEPMGVIATNDIEQIIAAKPDCVLYMPLLDHTSTDDMCRLLESGVNIVTTCTEFYHPRSMDPARRERIESACQRGGTTLFETGAAPGFISIELPFALSLMERELNRISVVQFADLSDRQSPQMMAKTFGIDPADVPTSQPMQRSGHGDDDSLRQFADVIGLPLDEVTRSVSFAVATKTVKIGVMTVEAGTVGAWKTGVSGLRDGKPLIEFHRTRYVTADLDPAWEVRPTGWHVIVDGDAPMEIDIQFAKENYGAISPGYNAHMPVNAVPAVCEAEPGWKTADELRLIPFFA